MGQLPPVRRKKGLLVGGDTISRTMNWRESARKMGVLSGGLGEANVFLAITCFGHNVVPAFFLCFLRVQQKLTPHAPVHLPLSLVFSLSLYVYAYPLVGPISTGAGCGVAGIFLHFYQGRRCCSRGHGQQLRRTADFDGPARIRLPGESKNINTNEHWRLVRFPLGLWFFPQIFFERAFTLRTTLKDIQTP